MPSLRYLTALCVAAATVLALPAPSSATTRYAASFLLAKGAGPAPCTDPAQPCTMTNALAQTTAGDDVQLRAGNYYVSSTFHIIGGPVPFADPVSVPAGVTLRGADPAQLPVIHVRPNAQAEPGVEIGTGGTIRDVAIAGTANLNTPISYSLALGINATGERISVTTTAAQGALQIACSMAYGSKLRSSACRGTGSAGAAAKVHAVSASSTNGSYSIRNVTAITTVPGSIGLNYGTSSGTVTATISNSVFRGPASDLTVRAGVAGGNTTANVDHSNWVTQNVGAVSGASAVLNSLGGNQTAATNAAPLFADAAAGDFRPLPGSSTIDAGVIDPTNNGTLALGGAPRWIGVTTDIGAHEFDPAAVVAPTPTPPPPLDAAAPEQGGAASGDTTAPRLTGLALAKSVKRSKGAPLRFTLSEAAAVTLSFGQPSSGRTVGGKCVKTTAKNRARKRCTRPNVRGTVTVAGKAGANTFTFNGRLSAKQRLKPGRFQLTARAVDAAKNASAPATRRFTLR